MRNLKKNNINQESKKKVENKTYINFDFIIDKPNLENILSRKNNNTLEDNINNISSENLERDNTFKNENNTGNNKENIKIDDFDNIHNDIKK